MIDAIVRQTMILIAQLSTVDGVRSPLSHVADEVFTSLVRELESQGVGKKVIADMSAWPYARTSKRCSVCRSQPLAKGKRCGARCTAYLAELPSASRAELIVHFKRDEEAKVRSILNDLVASGLVCRTGIGQRSALSRRDR